MRVASSMVTTYTSNTTVSAFPRNDYVHRSQRAPTAVHLGKTTTRLHCGFRGSKDAPLTASAHGGADLGKTTTRLHCGFLDSKDAQDTASAHACADLGESRRHWVRSHNAIS